MKRILALLVLFLLPALALAGEPAKGDNLFGVTYAYASPNTDFDTRAALAGLSYERFLVDDLSLEVGAFWPRPDPGEKDFSVNAGINYHFGPLFIPFRGVYFGATEQYGVASGAGVNFYAGPLNLRFTALVDYAMDTGVADRTSYTAEAAARFRF